MMRIRTTICFWGSVALLGSSCLVSGFCTAEYDPVYCTLQGIVYSNRCNAVAAGYDPADCTVPQQGFGATCPATVSSKIVCGPAPGTSFDNICLASQAGYVPSAECRIPTTRAPTRLPTRSPTSAPTTCVKQTATCAVTTGSKPCCTGLACRKVSASTTTRTCRKCLANASLCLENRDCCSNKCKNVSGKLRCKA